MARILLRIECETNSAVGSALAQLFRRLAPLGVCLQLQTFEAQVISSDARWLVFPKSYGRENPVGPPN